MTPEILREYIENPTPLPKIIVIYGPTASGKSAVAIEVAKHLKNAGYTPHVISADSRQIYRGLDIGTGKVTEEEMQGVPHHMLDIIDPTETYSMVDFRRDVDLTPALSGRRGSLGSSSLKERGLGGEVIPILCGGTGLYIDAVLYDMDYPDTPPDWQYREELEAIRATEGDEALWRMLHDVDPEYASELIPENYRYVMRGLEVIRATGRSKRDSQNTKKLRFSPLFLTPYTDSEVDRKALYAKINTRVAAMFQSGLIEEVERTAARYGSHCPGLETIGYKEVVDALEGKTTMEEAIALVQQHSRNYAKRQITWNKRYL